MARQTPLTKTLEPSRIGAVVFSRIVQLWKIWDVKRPINKELFHACFWIETYRNSLIQILEINKSLMLILFNRLKNRDKLLQDPLHPRIVSLQSTIVQAHNRTKKITEPKIKKKLSTHNLLNKKVLADHRPPSKINSKALIPIWLPKWAEDNRFKAPENYYYTFTETAKI